MTSCWKARMMTAGSKCESRPSDCVLGYHLMRARSINPQAPLLSGYLTGLLCRNDKLSKHGRTLGAIVLGLGDESVDPSHDSTLLIYGQKVASSDGAGPPRLRLCVGRRKAPAPLPSVRKVKPGEPLPRGMSFRLRLSLDSQVFADRLPSIGVSHEARIKEACS